MDEDGTLHWSRPKKGYYDEEYLPKALTGVDENGSLYFDNGRFPWKLADDFDSSVIGVLPRSQTVLDAEEAKRAVLSVYPDSAMAQCYRTLAESILNT